MTEITSHLYVGDATDVAGAAAAGIDVILNVAALVDDVCPTGLECYKVGLYDTYANSCEEFREALTIIANAISQGKKVLVHCFAGINRGPTVVCMYLAEYQGWTMAAALVHVQALHPTAHPTDELWAAALHCVEEFEDCPELVCCRPAIWQLLVT